MEYLLLIYSDENAEPRPQTPEGDAHFNAYMAFSEEVRQKGVAVGSNALQPVSTATTVRVRDGKTLTTDGPFAETKEQLGGYYLLTADAYRLPDAAARARIAARDRKYAGRVDQTVAGWYLTGLREGLQRGLVRVVHRVRGRRGTPAR